jgi:DNA-binding CsgD family transcriptional regulator
VVVHGVNARSALVGRDAELEAVGRLLDGSLPAALSLEGEPGIGKTSLWREAVALAAERGFTVLTARPADAEEELAFAALGDLFASSFDRCGHELAEPQRRPLGVALLREQPGAQPPDSRTIGVGALALLDRLVAEQPVLLAVDDAQWLDAPSRGVLSFVLRRLGERRVACLLAHRAGERPPLPLDALPAETVAVAPLTLGAIGHLLRVALDAAFRRPTLQRIHAVSGGNPLYALELGRAFLQRGEPGPGEEVVLPPSLDALVAERLQALPEETLEALWVASALAEPGPGALDPDALAPGVAAGVVALEGDRVRFTHPLLRSAASALRGAEERRALHARLAEAAEGAEERGRHLALAGDEPDEERAATIEAAAHAAGARGAAVAAAGLAERAWRLTPDPHAEEARRRGVLAAESAWAAGDYDRGRKIFDALLDAAPPGTPRAELYLRVVSQPRDMAETLELCTRGLAEADAHPGLQSELLTFRSMLHYVNGDLAGAAADADASLAAARASGDEAYTVKAAALVELIRFFAGSPVDREALERAAEADLAGGRPERYGPTYWLLLVLGWLDALDDARRWSERYLACADHLGDAYRGELLQGLATVEYRAGNLHRALELLHEGTDVMADFGVEQMQANTFDGLASVLIALGRLEEAREPLERGRALAAAASDAIGEQRYHWISCFLELSRGHLEAAAVHARTALDFRRRGIGPAEDATPIYRDAVDVLTALGAVDEAEPLVAKLEQAAAEVPRPRRVVTAARSRALLEAARGDLAAAEAAIGVALDEVGSYPIPFEAGRTHLVAATVYRRSRRRGAARAAALEAAETFARIDMPLWLAKARAELDRLGGRTAAGSSLTATEERVAALAAEGRPTKEIAAELVVSPKTVEKHLTSIYAKLGLRSRAELAARMQAP